MSKLFNSSVLFAVLGLSLLPLYQNCSSNISFDKGSDYALVNGEAEVVDFYISPSSWENRPKVNITAIVDNSNSMAPLQEKMSRALSSAINPLTDFSGSIRLYTTTMSANVDGADKISAYSYYVDKNNQISVSVPTQRPYRHEFSIGESFTQNENSVYAPLNYQPSNFTNVKSLFSQSVSNLGTAGSSKEEGLCALLKAGKLQSNENNGSFNTFLIVSNENDFSDLANCIDNKEYVSSAVTITKNNPCLTESDISNYETCMHKNKVRIEQKNKLVRHIANYSYGESKFGLVESPKLRAILSTKYNSYNAYYEHKELLKENNISFQANVVNDGLVVDSKTFNTIVDLGNGACSSTAEVACDSSTIASIESQTWTINGRNAVLDKNTCKMKCESKPGPVVKTNLNNTNNFYGLCANAAFDTENFCAGKVDCSAKCTQNSLKTLTTYSSRYEDSCERQSVEKTNFNSSFFASLGISSNYYDSPSDALNQIISSDAFSSANVACGSYKKFHLLTEKEGVVSLQSSNYVTYTPSFYDADLVNYECSSMTGEAKNLFQSKGIQVDSLSLLSCAKKDYMQAASVSEDLELDWSESLEGTSCTLSSSLKSKIPNYVPESNITCRVSSYIKDTNILCEIGTQRNNLCSTGSLLNKFKTSCPDRAEEVNFEKEYSFLCNSEIVGNYSLDDESIQNQVRVNKFIPNSNTDSIAEYLESKFGNNYYLANFITPANTDSEYDSCVAENRDAFSYGQKYLDLAESILRISQEDKSSVDSICKDSYAPALERVVSKILGKIEFTYRLSLNSNESIYKVFLVNKAGRERFIGADKYVYSNGLIKFIDKDLITEDISSIRVQIWRDLLVAISN